MNYYNDIDPYVCQALRNMIDAKLIPQGVVDERPIEDIRPSDLDGFTQVHFFAGIAGWSFALSLIGYPPDQPIWTGSCPCQPYSAAGKGNGFDDERHLWPYWQWLISKCKPTTVVGEQVASKLAEPWIDLVFDDLEGLGYACAAAAFPAAGVGAQFIGDRLYWAAVASSTAERNQQPRKESCSWQAGRVGRFKQPVSWDTPWQSALPSFRTVGDGLPRRIGATDAARNAIVPYQAAEFLRAVL